MSFLKGERYIISDVSKFDFVFIKSGRFCFKLAASKYTDAGEDTREDVLIGEGEYID